MGTLDNFVEKKKADSSFLSLDDGEQVHVVELKDMRMISKVGYDGSEKDVIRFKCAVMTSEGVKDKDFDNGTQRFAEEMQKNKIQVGSSFTITRAGTMTKTRYNLSEVVNPGDAPAPAAPTAAPVATAPVATAPVATAPVATAPVATAPVATAPVATAPVATAPVATAPAPAAPTEAAPISAPVAPEAAPATDVPQAP